MTHTVVANHLVRALLIASCLLTAACQRQADISKPLTFREGSISFEYPSNWEVTENTEDEVGRSITLEEPGHAIVILSIFPEATEVSLGDFARTFASTISETPLMKTHDITSTSGGVNVRFSTASIPHTANLSLHKLGPRSAILLTQVADEDRTYVQPGFDLIRRTLK